MGTMITPKPDRNGTYYIRKAVPKELQYIVGKTALKKSLKTKFLKDANLFAPPVILEFNSAIESARLKHDSDTQLSNGVIASFIESWLCEALITLRHGRSQNSAPNTEVYSAEMLRIETSLKKSEENPNFVSELALLVKSEIDCVKKCNQLMIDEKSHYWSVFVTYLAKAKIKLLQEAAKLSIQNLKVAKKKEGLSNLPKISVKNDTQIFTVKALYERYCRKHLLNPVFSV